jgi:hypothetical protein
MCEATITLYKHNLGNVYEKIIVQTCASRISISGRQLRHGASRLSISGSQLKHGGRRLHKITMVLADLLLMPCNFSIQLNNSGYTT